MVESWFFDRVLSTIQKYRMLEAGDKVLVAVSGGPDSVALLHFLKQVETVYGLSLHVFHLNHEIRGREAAEDAQFVAGLASKLGVSSTLMRFDVPELAERNKLSLEEAAREARYRLMGDLAAKIKASKIALGHHADDQVETFLMRLIRGAGLEGLVSILPVRDLYIRPFIEITKDDILEYIKDNGLDFRIDASNEDLSILRNKIRHELIPLLTDYNPQFRGSLLKTIEVVREDQSHLNELTNAVFEALADVGNEIVRMPIQGLLAQSLSLRRRLVRKSIKWVKSDLRGIEFKHVEAILRGLSEVPARFELELPGNIIVFTEYEQLVFAKKHLFAAPKLEVTELKIPGITFIEPLGIAIEAEHISPRELKFEKNGNVAHLDAEKVPPKLKVRTRKPGDAFMPFGMVGEKKLQDFLVDEKVPRRERDRIPIVVGDDKVIWVAGFRIDDRFKVTEDTKQVLVLKLRQ
ncbi:MAG: tRNA lysidine(34) synthetase TilS [Firmicutes bacterium]|nr:tRNA lysidine(34) synthetase TilS [Bacillota bacterium]